MSNHNGKPPMIPPGFPGGGPTRPVLPSHQPAVLATPMNDMQLIELMASHIFAGRETHQMPDTQYEGGGLKPGDIVPMTPQIAAGLACQVFAECRVLVMEQSIVDRMVQQIKQREGLVGPTPEEDEAEEQRRKERRAQQTGPALVNGENGA